MEIGADNLASVPKNHLSHCTVEFGIEENQTDDQWADCTHVTSSESKHCIASADDGIDVVSADGENFVCVSATLNDEEEEIQKESPLSYELQQGYRILRELMADSIKSVNWPFMYRVDDSYPETRDYYERVKKPMWLMQMKEKFDQREYGSITEYVSDFRLMLENCYRYNGPDHFISKKGQKLETMLEQKLALLSRELRAKTTIAATTGKTTEDDIFSSGLRRRPKTFLPHDSSALLSQLRSEEAQREREHRRQQIADRKAANEAVQHEILEWEDSLLAHPIKTHMLHSWELPQIGLFLFLCQEALNLGEVSQFELERCLAMPRQSTTLQYIMTSLLSTPSQRQKLDKKTVMPYRVWTQKLTKKMDLWYKTLDEFHVDKTKAAYKLGFDPCSFDMMGLKNPLRRRAFHQNSFYRRVWILKCLCDHCLETQESLRSAIEAQPPEDQREYILGNDAKGSLYLHFPQFCGADLRIYRQRKPPDLSFNGDEEEDPSVKDVKAGTEKSGPERANSSKDMQTANVSLNSSPELRENGRKMRKRGRRHSPVPEKQSLDLATALWFPGTENRIRKTRNSVEASLPFVFGNSDCTNGCWRSKRSKAASHNVNESSDKSCSNLNNQKDRDAVKAEGKESGRIPVNESNSCDSEVTSFHHAANSGTGDGELKERSVDSVQSEQDPLVQHSTSFSEEDKKPGSNTAMVRVGNGSTDGHVTQTIMSKNCDATSFQNGSDKKPVEVTLPPLAPDPSHHVCDSKKDCVMYCSESNCDKSSFQNTKMENSNGSLKTSPSHTSSAHETVSVIQDHTEFHKTELPSNPASEDCSVQESGDPHPELEDSVRVALLDHVNYSVSVTMRHDPRSTRKNEIMLDEEEEEGDESPSPDLDEFELIVDSVEGLQELVKQFARPQVPPSDTARKARKQKISRPPQRKPCEVALHERLALLLKELQPWESKLVQATRRMRVKIRREFEDFEEDPVEEADEEGWDTDTEGQSSEEAGEGNSSGEEGEESRDSQAPHLLATAAASSSAKKKGLSATPSTASDLTEAERDVEEYELDVSSRGRLRKRRLIPNNIEDQGIKKKKIVKKPEDSAHLPDMLQKVQTGNQPMPPDLSAAGIANGEDSLSVQAVHTTIQQFPVSGTQLLSLPTQQSGSIISSAEISHHQTVISPQSLHSLQTTFQIGEAAGVGNSAGKQVSHPEIQKLLSVRRPIVVRDRYAPYKTVAKDTGGEANRDILLASTSTVAQRSGGKADPTAPTSGSTDHTSLLAKLSSPAATTKGAKGAGNQQGTAVVLGLVGGKPHLVNLNSLPPSVLQQLVRNNALRLQPVATPQNSNATIVGSKPVACLSATPSDNLNQTTEPATSPQPALSSSAVASGLHKVGGQQPSTVLLRAVSPGSHLVPVRMQGVPRMVGPGKAVQEPAVGTIGTEAAGSSTRPHVSLLNSPGRQPQRYAGNVTVRTLLENRVCRKSSDDAPSPEKQAPSAEPQFTVSSTDAQTGVAGQQTFLSAAGATPLTLLGITSPPIAPATIIPMASSLLATSPPLTTSVTMAVAGGAVPSGLLKKTVPGILRLPSQSTLDYAVKAVVTTCVTTLPTANIKVPSPKTLPNLSPRKNVTKTVQSMKAPIPIATTVISRTEDSGPLVTCPGGGTNGLSGSGIDTTGVQSGGTLSGVVSGTQPAHAGTVLVSRGKEGTLLESSEQKQVLVRVLPQGPTGPHTFVQGIATPQGIVLPQGALLKMLQPQAALLGAPRETQSAAQGQQGLSSPIKVVPSSASTLCPPVASQQVTLGSTLTTNKVSTEVIRTMLAAKVTSASPVAPLSVITTQAASDYIVVSPQNSHSPARLLMQAPGSSAGIGPSSTQSSATMAPTLLLRQQAAESQSPARPQIATTQVTHLTTTQGALVSGAGAVRQIHLPVGQVGRLLSGFQLTGVAQAHQKNHGGVRLVGQHVTSPKAEKVMAASLPASLQIRGLAGPSVVHLVSPGQAASSSSQGSNQPMVATLQGGTSAAVDLQQLQFLTSATGLQKVHVISPQPAQMIAVTQLTAASPAPGHPVRMVIPSGTSSGQVIMQLPAAPAKNVGTDKTDGSTMPGTMGLKLQSILPPPPVQAQQGLSQVCLKVQPAPVPTSCVTASSVGNVGCIQAPEIKTVPSKPASANLASPVATVASTVSALTAPLLTTSPNPEAESSVSVNSHVTVRTCDLLSSNSVSATTLGNSSLLGQPQSCSIAPSTSTTVLAVKPQQTSMKPLLTQPATPKNLAHVTAASRFQMTITPDPKTGHLTVRPQPLPSAAALNNAEDVGTLELSATASVTPSVNTQSLVEGMEKGTGSLTGRSLSSNGEQGVKWGLSTSAAGNGQAGLSGAVLASLSQMVGAKIAVQTGSNPSAADDNIQGIVSAALKKAQAPVTSVSQVTNQIQGFGQTLKTVTSHTTILPQQQTLVVRAAGGQVISPVNVPVTVNSSILRVLPKASLQVGTQVMTVRTPPKSMGPHLNNPATIKMVVSKACEGRKPLVDGSFTDEVARGFLSTQSESVLPHSSLLSHSLHGAKQTPIDETQSSRDVLATTATLPQAAGDGGSAVRLNTCISSAAMTTSGSNTYAAIEHSDRAVTSSLEVSLAQAINGMTAAGAVATADGNTADIHSDSIRPEAEGGSDKNLSASGDVLMEKEQAALNLLTLANQFHLN